MKTLFPLLKPSGPRLSTAWWRLQIILLASLLSLLTGWSASAQNFPAGFSAALVVNGLVNPTTIAFLPDGRIFIAEQQGRLRIVKNGVLLPTPFLSVSVNADQERGLIGVTADPNFATNGYVYIYYTLPNAANNRIVRYTASAANGDVADPNSARTVLDLDPLSSAPNHNGGAMHFGPDGKLYVAVGENAGGEIPSQSLDSYMGKLLRINPDGSVPSGNPYVGSGLSQQRQRIWSSGLRNPYTFSIQPGTSKIFINDVGGGSWEEINDATVGGRNFGWQHSEGYTGLRPGESAPLYAYGHGSALPTNQSGCAITGGTFFNPTRGTNYPAAYIGKYFYQDLCNNWINYIDPNSSSPAPFQPFATNLPSQSLGLETGPDGNLYYLSRYPTVALFKIVYTAGNSAPVITTQPSNASVAPGKSVTFSVAAAGTAPLSYQWQKNGVNIAGATGSSFTIASPVSGDAGQYRVVVSNSIGTATSNTATLTITAPNTPPTATILTPANGTTYVAGTTISFSGDATDPEQGTLPASAFSWMVNFHHDTHVHNGTPFNQGAKTGTFSIPSDGEEADNVWYRLILTVTDAGGLQTTTYRDIFPRKSTITLATNPAGLQLSLGGGLQGTPFAALSVEGLTRTLVAPATQTVGGVTYEFVSWSDGGAQTHAITTPTDDVTYTATFRPVTTGVTLRPADNPANTTAGLDYAYYEGSWTALPNFAALTPVKTGTAADFSLTPRLRSDLFAFRHTGYVSVPTDGEYTFFTTSDDGSQLFIGSTLVVNNDGLHGAQERSGKIGLKAGVHALTVTFFERDGGEVLEVAYAGPGIARTALPASALRRPNAPTALRPADNPANTTAGLDYAYYEGSWTALPDFAALTPVKTGTAADFSLTPRLRSDLFAFRYTGYVRVPSDGTYTFATTSDDGSKLFIGSTLVVNNDGLHGAQEVSGTIGLRAGLHAITVTFFEQGGGEVLSVSYAGPGLSKMVVPASALLRAPAAARLAPAARPATAVSVPGVAFQLYPNPARDRLNVRLLARARDEVRVEVRDALNRRVAGTSLRATAGWNEVRLPLRQLPAGVYTVDVSCGTERSVQRLVVAP